MTVRALPRSLEDLRGRRAARWIRESTAGQADNFGPDVSEHETCREIAAKSAEAIGVSRA